MAAPGRLAMKESTSSALGFAIAALPIAVVGALTSPGLGGGLEADFKSLLFVTMFFYVYSIFFTLLLALPIFLLLRRYRLVRWYSSTGAGFLIGIAVAALYFGRFADASLQWAMFSITGAVSGLLFWTIWRRGVPAE